MEGFVECPFCSSVDIVIETFDDNGEKTYRAVCDSCYCMMGSTHTSAEGARKQWNRRVDTRLDAAIAQCKKRIVESRAGRRVAWAPSTATMLVAKEILNILEGKDEVG